MPEHRDDRIQIRFRLPMPVLEALQVYGEGDGLSLNYVATKALREFLRRVAVDTDLPVNVRVAAANATGQALHPPLAVVSSADPS